MKIKEVAIPLAIDIGMGAIWAAIFRMFSKKQGDQTVWDLKKLRSEAPGLVHVVHYDQKLADEAAHARVVGQLPAGLQKTYLEHWLPSLGWNQKQDVIMSIAEMTVGANDTEKRANEAKAVQLLVEINRILMPHLDRRSDRAASLRFMRRNEADYPIVKVLTALGWTGNKLMRELRRIQVTLRWNYRRYSRQLRAFDNSAAAAAFVANASTELATARAEASTVKLFKLW